MVCLVASVCHTCLIMVSHRPHLVVQHGHMAVVLLCHVHFVCLQGTWQI